jgi:hypothetical protein
MTLNGDSLTLPLPELVQKLFSIIGRKLTAYVIGAKDTRAVDRLIEGDLAPEKRTSYSALRY